MIKLLTISQTNQNRYNTPAISTINKRQVSFTASTPILNRTVLRDIRRLSETCISSVEEFRDQVISMLRPYQAQVTAEGFAGLEVKSGGLFKTTLKIDNNGSFYYEGIRRRKSATGSITKDGITIHSMINTTYDNNLVFFNTGVEDAMAPVFEGYFIKTKDNQMIFAGLDSRLQKYARIDREGNVTKFILDHTITGIRVRETVTQTVTNPETFDYIRWFLQD